MAVHVEFYGVARARAGRATLKLEQIHGPTTLAAVLQAIEQAAPSLRDTVLAQGQLLEGFVANLDGERFVSDPTTEVPEGAHLLISSADVGG